MTHSTLEEEEHMEGSDEAAAAATAGDGDGNDGGACTNDESIEEGEKTNLIVNYLPQQMTDEEFKELFTKFGEMKSCKIVRNRMTGYSYGFGFVDFETHEQALKAIEELNGHELDTKKIKVAFARPAGQDIKQANLYVKNIPPDWTQDDVRKAFESHGNIIQVRVLGNNRGVAFVLYDLRKQAEMALEAMQGKKLDGAEEPLEIKFAADKKSEKKRSRGRGGRGNNNNNGSNNNTSNASNEVNDNNNNNNNNSSSNTSGRTRERGNRGGVNRNRNRSQSDSRNRPQGSGGGQRSQSNQRGGGNRQMNNHFNNNNNNMNQMNNNGFGPIRHQASNRMHRFAPFAPVQPAAPQPPAGYAAYPNQQQAQYMYPTYMMAGQQPMMQLNPSAPTQPMGPAAPAMTPMGAFQFQTSQMAPIGYGTTAPTAAAAATVSQAQTMNSMYHMASSTMQNAAQMQPQLGQPMNQMRPVGGGSTMGGQQADGGSNNNDGITLFVYNIGPQSDETELRSMFAPYGQVLRCNVVRKTPGGETKGFGFVTLKDRNQANAAIASLNGSPRNGKTLQVSFKK